jgi:serine carboxypeptidase-like clade 2
MKFPEWKKNNVYIAGESYAGIYIPYLMDKIDNYNAETAGIDNDINLKGIIVGNGCTDWQKDTTPAMIDMLYEHHFFSQKEYDTFRSNCLPVQNWMTKIFDDEQAKTLPKDCLDSLISIFNRIADGKLNAYDIYGKCYNFDD